MRLPHFSPQRTPRGKHGKANALTQKRTTGTKRTQAPQQNYNRCAEQPPRAQTPGPELKPARRNISPARNSLTHDNRQRIAASARTNALCGSRTPAATRIVLPPPAATTHKARPPRKNRRRRAVFLCAITSFPRRREWSAACCCARGMPPCARDPASGATFRPDPAPDCTPSRSCRNPRRPS